MGLARQYLLEVQQKLPSGSTTINQTVTYSLLDAFDGIRPDTTPFSYFAITLVDLQGMNNTQYNTRVMDFLYYVNIDSVFDYNNLLADADYETGDCV